MEARFKRIKNIDDLYFFEKEWKELEQGSEMTAFQTYDWNKLLVQEALNDKMNSFFREIYVYYIVSNEKIVMLLPIITQKISNKFKWIGRKKGVYILGYGSYSDYLNAIYEHITEKAVKTLIDSIKRDFPSMKLYFHYLRNNKFSNILSDFCHKFEENIAVSVNILSSVEEYNKILSKSTRQNLRTSLNRMNKNSITYKIEILNKIDDASLRNKLVDLHIKRTKIKLLKDAKGIKWISSWLRFHVVKYREKHNNIINESMKVINESFVLIVYLEDNVAGYLYGLKEKESIRIMQNCFDMNYNFYSPLFRACYDLIIDVIENDKYKEIDFTRGTEEYKYKLGGSNVIIESYEI